MKILKYNFAKFFLNIHNVAIKVLFASMIILASIIINSFNNYIIIYFSNLPDGGAVFILIFQTIILYLYANFILIPLPRLLSKYMKWFKENSDVADT